MEIKAIKSDIITAGDDIFRVIKGSLHGQRFKEKTVLVVSSKAAATAGGRIVKIGLKKEFDNLVRTEADKIFGSKKGSNVTLALKNNIFAPWAGLDRSNIQKGFAVQWPEDPDKSAEQIMKKIKKKYGIKDFGVIISDSFCAPLRRGVTAVAIGIAGFKGVRELKGKKDLFGNSLTVSRQGVADMLASAAHLVMGESDERTPFALITGAPVDFTSARVNSASLVMDPGECLYSPLYKEEL